jgi:hypothetical protein
MSTVETIATRALSKLGIVGSGQTPEAADLTLAINALKSLYHHYINAGTFGALEDYMPVDSPYDAPENSRIVHDGSITVVLPTEYPASYQTDDYGMIGTGYDIGYVRPPSDLAIVSEVNTDTGIIKDSIYDNRIHEWLNINTLVAANTAPLSHRDEDGLASVLALRIAPDFGAEPHPLVARAAFHFEEALANNWSIAGEWVQPRDYF